MMTNTLDVGLSLQNALKHPTPYIQQRAQIILLTLDDTPVESIIEQVGVSRKTVQKWQAAWADKGIDIFPEDVLVVADTASAEHTGSAVVDPLETTPAPLRLNIDLHDSPGIVADDPMWEAGRKLLLYNLEQLLLHEPIAILGEDIEGVHKTRVATRRMRSAFDVFGEFLDPHYYRGIQKHLRKTARSLGRVRDLDVLLQKTHTYIETALDNDPTSLQPLLTILDEQHTHARNKLLKWLQSKKYDRFITSFYSLLQQPSRKMQSDDLDDVVPTAYQVNQVVPRLIYGCLEAIRAYEPHLGEADVDTLHMLRIEFKRFRYTLEFFSEVLGESVQAVISATKKIQDHLGDMNDAQVAYDRTRAIRKQLPKAEREGLDVYRKARQAEMRYLVRSFPDAWEEFNRPELRQALALAVAAL